MTEKEKEVIEWTKNVIKTIEESQMLFLEDVIVKLGTKAHNNLQEILNLIEKQDNKIKELEKEVGEKDKTILKMAKAISNFEDYCIDNVCDEGLNNYCKEEKCTNDFTDCIIEYFEKKEE